jgi:hypothetical protein
MFFFFFVATIPIRSIRTGYLIGLKMTTLFKLREHLMFLLVEDKLCFSEGDWDRLDQIRMAIDDTRTQIEKLEKA